MGGPDLHDINGNQIVATKWYKIVLLDGRELGFGVKDKGRDSCAPAPAGQGLVLRYRRNQNDQDHIAYGWPTGDKGYFKGYTVTPEGVPVFKHLSLSNGAPPILAWYDSDDSYGFVAKQLPGNRIALYALDQNKAVAGLKVQQVGGGLSMHGTQGAYPIPFDCALMEVGPHDNANLWF